MFADWSDSFVASNLYLLNLAGNYIIFKYFVNTYSVGDKISYHMPRIIVSNNILLAY